MARVLIVDDTDIVRKALELAVRKMGHDARSTPSARKALELAIADPPDLALLDFRMPEMNGVALYGAMQAALGARCPAVLFVSATPPEEVRAKSPPELKPAGYVRKPFQLQDLSEKVGEVLGT